MICDKCGGIGYLQLTIIIKLKYTCSDCYGLGIVRPYNIDELFKANKYIETKDKIIVVIDEKEDIVTLENAGYEYISSGAVTLEGAYLTFRKPTKKHKRYNKNV